MYKVFLCLRYLRKRRIAFFGIAAVTLCVALLIVITSLFNGFIKSLHSYWRQSWGQIVLFPNRPLYHFGALVEQLEQVEGVSSVKAVIGTGALLYIGPGDVRGVELQGIDLAQHARDQSFRGGFLLQDDKESVPRFDLSDQAREAARTWFQRKLHRPVEDSELPVGAIVGIGILAQPDELTDQYNHLAVLEQIRQRKAPLFIISGTFDNQSDQDTPSVKKIRKICWPVDVIQTGTHYADTHFIYLPFDYVRNLIGITGPDGRKQCIGRILIYLKPQSETFRVKEQIRRSWRQFAHETLNWPGDWINEAQIFESMKMPHLRLVTREIRKQLAIMQLIMGLICLVVALLIFVILFMIVMQKTKDIGIMRALGTSRRGVALVFLGYGAGIGVTGAVLGLALGTWATQNINIIESLLTQLLGFKMWKSGVYLFSSIPNEVDWDSVVWIIMTGLLTATIGALLPALRAGQVQPVEALRYE